MMSWKFGAMVLSMVAIAACGSDGKTGTTSGDTGGSGGTGSGGNVSATTGTTTGTTATGTGTSTGTGGDSCMDGSDCTVCEAPTKSNDSCLKCCNIATPVGLATYSSLLLNNCACEAASKCYSACGVNGAAPDFCADMTKVPSMACGTCLSDLKQTDMCVTSFVKACQASADCISYTQCVNGCTGMP